MPGNPLQSPVRRKCFAHGPVMEFQIPCSEFPVVPDGKRYVRITPGSVPENLNSRITGCKYNDGGRDLP